ncbi:MAG: hypothetical protein AUJ32_01225 [Parcubacteria group bacterium CG1_02_40_82]|nr:MAG: hypothetical protein AUJ32_01225 [Parcubacteria group bacterium CG1_02_40_82]
MTVFSQIKKKPDNAGDKAEYGIEKINHVKFPISNFQFPIHAPPCGAFLDIWTLEILLGIDYW